MAVPSNNPLLDGKGDDLGFSPGLNFKIAWFIPCFMGNLSYAKSD